MKMDSTFAIRGKYYLLPAPPFFMSFYPLLFPLFLLPFPLPSSLPRSLPLDAVSRRQDVLVSDQRAGTYVDVVGPLLLQNSHVPREFACGHTRSS